VGCHRSGWNELFWTSRTARHRKVGIQASFPALSLYHNCNKQVASEVNAVSGIAQSASDIKKKFAYMKSVVKCAGSTPINRVQSRPGPTEQLQRGNVVQLGSQVDHPSVSHPRPRIQHLHVRPEVVLWSCMFSMHCLTHKSIQVESTCSADLPAACKSQPSTANKIRSYSSSGDTSIAIIYD